MPSYDQDCLGTKFRVLPCQANVMVVTGTVIIKLAPECYNQMPEAQRTVSMGSCANGGGGGRWDCSLDVLPRCVRRRPRRALLRGVFMPRLGDLGVCLQGQGCNWSISLGGPLCLAGSPRLMSRGLWLHGSCEEKRLHM